jgi:DNA-binding transcriptional regulator YiaG
MSNCTDCGSNHVEATVLPVYETDLGGIQVKLVNAVIREKCRDCGEETIEIPDLDGLAKTVAMARALIPYRLNSREVRFMRTALDMTGRAFADAMELTPETVSRWENDERGIGGSTEKLLRHNVCALLHSQVAGFNYDPADITRMKIMNTPEGFVLPPLEFHRVMVEKNHDHNDIEAWDQMSLPKAA